MPGAIAFEQGNSLSTSSPLLSDGPADRQKAQQIAASLAMRVEAGADAAQIADATVAAFQQIEAALAPVIGQRGVVALSKRSVYVAGQTWPWLLGLHEDLQAALDLAALRSAIARQDSNTAAAGGAALLQKFHDLLTALIGASLTERLLRPAWTNLLNGAPAQDSSP